MLPLPLMVPLVIVVNLVSEVGLLSLDGGNGAGEGVIRLEESEERCRLAAYVLSVGGILCRRLLGTTAAAEPVREC